MEILRAAAPDAARALVGMVQGKIKVGATIRKQACDSVLDRVLGKPVQTVAGDAESPLTIGVNDQLWEIFRRLEGAEAKGDG